MPPTDARAGAKVAVKDVGSRVGRLELYTTVFVTGGVVMTIEVVGTRIVGPVFGVGLFVWSALLAVTLGPAGYFSVRRRIAQVFDTHKLVLEPRQRHGRPRSWLPVSVSCSG